MNVLILGSGGREHALAWAIKKSPLCTNLYVAPGNGGMQAIATVVDADITDHQAMLDLIAEFAIDFVVVGPELPLTLGVADALREHGIPVFGPGKAGAKLEASKSFAKDFMVRHGISTASYQVFNAKEDALAYIDEIGAPCVVKANGLAAGKGVVVAHDKKTAREAVVNCFEGVFGEDAGSTVVIEEFLEGPECSLLALVCDGEAVMLPCAQDHKRVGEGDTGANTGGMGVYSPVPLVDNATYEQMVGIVKRAVEGLQADGITYRGVLYTGFMLTEQGPKVLEYNARFGDPETQVILPRLASDALELLYAVAQGELASAKSQVVWDENFTFSVVICSGGYPDAYQTGFPIDGFHPQDAQPFEAEGVLLFHAGTRLLVGDPELHAIDGQLVTSGGRVLNVTGVAPTFEEARDRAYRVCEKIAFEGSFYRRDIGHWVLKLNQRGNVGG